MYTTHRKKGEYSLCDNQVVMAHLRCAKPCNHKPWCQHPDRFAVQLLHGMVSCVWLGFVVSCELFASKKWREHSLVRKKHLNLMKESL